MLKTWYRTRPHNAGRSIALVRLAAASILLAHPAYAFLHPENIRGFAHFLASRGLPWSPVLAWAALFLQAGCSLALLARRLVIPACLGNIFVLAIGIALIHFPKWRTVGLPDGERQPGSEFSVLLIACLLAILWAHWRGTGENPGGTATLQALEAIRLAAALILVLHPLEGLRNPAALTDLGSYFSSIGFPFGVTLVWGAMFLQIASSAALVFRRLIVPACLGHMLVLVTGICLFHAPHWFAIGPNNVVGPGHEGMEYSILLISCFVSLILAYWPKQPRLTNAGFSPA